MRNPFWSETRGSDRQVCNAAQAAPESEHVLVPHVEVRLHVEVCEKPRVEAYFIKNDLQMYDEAKPTMSHEGRRRSSYTELSNKVRDSESMT